MKTSRFIVENQILKLDPTCDCSDLVPGTKGYLNAEFSFSKEWDDMAKVVGFYSPLGREYSRLGCLRTEGLVLFLLKPSRRESSKSR